MALVWGGVAGGEEDHDGAADEELPSTTEGSAESPRDGVSSTGARVGLLALQNCLSQAAGALRGA